MPRQMMQPNVQGPAAAANVRFNQSARNLAGQQPPNAGPRPAVPMRPEAPLLSSMSEQERKQVIGEQIFKKIAKITPDKAGKITGMVIGMETSELLKLLQSDEALHAKASLNCGVVSLDSCLSIIKQCICFI